MDEEMKEELNTDLHQALDLLEYVHAAIWTHFDPTGEHGARGQPKDVKAVMKKIRGMLDKHGMTMEGFKVGE